MAAPIGPSSIPLAACRKQCTLSRAWDKQHGTLRKIKHRGLAQVTSDFLLNIIAYNLIRIPKLINA